MQFESFFGETPQYGYDHFRVCAAGGECRYDPAYRIVGMDNVGVLLPHGASQLAHAFQVGFPSLSTNREKRHIKAVLNERLVLRAYKGTYSAYTFVSACYKDYFQF